MAEEDTSARVRIFDEQTSRYPNHYPWTEGFIKAMWDGQWTPDEFDFESDFHDFYTTLTEEQRGVVVRALSAIGQIEIDVKLKWARIGDTLKHPSITDMGLTMAGIEVIHNKAYEKLLVKLGLTDVFQQNLVEGVIKDRVKYLKKHNKKAYGDDKKQFVYSLILFTLFVENVSLFSQFYVILWFNRYKNVLKDTSQQVNYTKLEELIHGMAGTKLVNTIREEYPELFDGELEDRVQKEAREAYSAESKIIDWILGDYEDGTLNKDVLKAFVMQRINESLIDIGMRPVYDVDERLRKDMMWMQEEILANNMADFFYKRPVEYTKNSQVFSYATVFGESK